MSPSVGTATKGVKSRGLVHWWWWWWWRQSKVVREPSGVERGFRVGFGGIQCHRCETPSESADDLQCQDSHGRVGVVTSHVDLTAGYGGVWISSPSSNLSREWLVRGAAWLSCDSTCAKAADESRQRRSSAGCLVPTRTSAAAFTRVKSELPRRWISTVSNPSLTQAHATSLSSSP
jgi:hypothetical protein